MRAATTFAIIGAGLAVGSMFGARAGFASGDAPWCAVTQLGEGAGAWNCEYDTVEECLPAVVAGNRGQCSPNPYARALAPASAPAATPPVSAPATNPTSTTPGTAQKRKAQKDAK
jgi:hypothetical protein